MLTLEFYNKTLTKIPETIFSDLLLRAHAALAKEHTIKPTSHFWAEVTFVGTARMTFLNTVYHHKNRSTDVISLSYFEKKMKDPFLGEIFICLPYARAQAQKIGQSLNEEVRFLFVHGLLHLFGYDHKKTKEEVHMKKLAYTILGRD